MVNSKINKITAKKLFFICIAMFLFSFALIPLYNVICDVTGLNGNTSNLKEKANTFSEATIMESNDKLNIQFISHETIKNKNNNNHNIDIWKSEVRVCKPGFAPRPIS